ncbi:MAG: alpha/beta fold hydrolase [Clostridiaceae bacterium]
MTIDAKTGLYFEALGSQNTRSIVFLHGGGIAGWMWRYQVEYFKTKYHCLVPDLPEQGQSAGVGPFSVEGAADLIADFIRVNAHGGKAHVVGLSEGAVVLVALLSRHPEVVDHAVCSSAILRELPGNWMYTPALFKWSYRWFMAPFKNNDWWIRLNMHGAAGVSDEFYPEFKRSFQTTTESGFANLMVNAIHYRLPTGLAKANLPVLVALGKLEYKQMRQSGQDLLAALPNAQGVMVSLGKGSSLAKEHNWAMTAPQLFNQTVAAWIEDRALPEELLPLMAEKK